MKKINIIAVLILSLLYIGLYSQSAMRIAPGKHIFLHPDRSLTFGNAQANAAGTPNNGQFSMEQYWGGLHIYKAWPTWGHGMWKMHLNDLGMLGVNMRAMTRTYTGSWNSSQNQWACYLWVNGRAASDGWYTYSDSSMKGNVSPLNNSLEKVLAMKPVSYVYKSRKFAGHDTIPDSLTSDLDSGKLMAIRADKEKLDALPELETTVHYGFIAQELKRVCPDVVAELGPTEGVNLPEIVPLLVHSIQVEHKSKDSLKKELDSLKTLVQNLRQEIINWQGRSIDTIGQSKSRLFQNNPNPFDGNTTITYFIDENTAVTSANIEVRNIMGTLQSTITLNDGTGLGSVQYNGSNLTPGYYIYTLKINGSVKDSKMFLKEM